MTIIQWLITTVILACLFAGMRDAVNAGHYWVFVAVPLGAIWLGYLIGNEEDRADYRRASAWIRDRLARLLRASSSGSNPE